MFIGDVYTVITLKEVSLQCTFHNAYLQCSIHINFYFRTNILIFFKQIYIEIFLVLSLLLFLPSDKLKTTVCQPE